MSLKMADQFFNFGGDEEYDGEVADDDEIEEEDDEEEVDDDAPVVVTVEFPELERKMIGTHNCYVIDESNKHFLKALSATFHPVLLQYIDSEWTQAFFTSFEKSKALASRCRSIEEGSPITVDHGDLTKTLDIASKEINEGRSPVYIRRPRNNYTGAFYFIHINSRNSLGLPMWSWDF
jgi:DNA-directed RNA polymerase subunit K/omega